MNPLQQWLGSIDQDLTSLREIDVTGNSKWIPDKNVLQLKTLREIKGIYLGKHCSDCSLVRDSRIHNNTGNTKCNESKAISKGTCKVCNPVKCLCVTHYFANATVTFSQYGFVFSGCKTGDKCFESLSRKIITNPCIRRHVLPFAILQRPIGIAGILLNMIAVVNIFTTQSLRKNVSLLLAGNMSFCDLLMCVYSVSLTVVHSTISFDSFIRNIRSICLPFGFLWYVGLTVSAFTSTLLTIERYLAVVFAMKPSIRLRKKYALIFLFGVWLLCSGMALFALLEEYSTHNSFCIPGSSVFGSQKHMRFLMATASIGVILFLVTAILYIHIYIVVCRSSKTMRSKTEVRVSLRIAILVFSSMAFFFLPTFVTLILTFSGTYPKGVEVDGSGSGWEMALAMYFPSFCFNLNSFLNPLWYTFRNEKFKTVLRRRIIQGYLKVFGNCCKTTSIERAVFYVDRGATTTTQTLMSKRTVKMAL